MPVVYGFAEEGVGGSFSVRKAMNGGEREASGKWWVVEKAEGAADGRYSCGALADGARVLWRVVVAHLCAAARAGVVFRMAFVVVVDRMPG